MLKELPDQLQSLLKIPVPARISHPHNLHIMSHPAHNDHPNYAVLCVIPAAYTADKISATLSRNAGVWVDGTLGNQSRPLAFVAPNEVWIVSVGIWPRKAGDEVSNAADPDEKALGVGAIG